MSSSSSPFASSPRRRLVLILGPRSSRDRTRFGIAFASCTILALADIWPWRLLGVAGDMVVTALLLLALVRSRRWSRD